MKHRIARKNGAMLTRMVNVPISGAGLEGTGEVIGESELRIRARVLMEIVRTHAQQRIEEIFSAERAEELQAKGHAYVAMERCYGKPAWPPKGVHASSRVQRMAEELAGRTLRSAARRLGILAAYVPLWKTPQEYKTLTKDEQKACSEAVWKAMPQGTTEVEVAHARRQLAKFYRHEKRKAQSAYEVSECPKLKQLTLPLDAGDKQLVTLEEGDEFLLRILLPTKEQPGVTDWAWHKITLALPDWAKARYGDWEACKPSLQITEKGCLKVLLPLETLAPAARRLKKSVAGPLQVRGFSLDWGQRSLLTGAVVEPSGTPSGVFTTGRQYKFSAMPAQVNLYRTRGHAENLARKVDHLGDLLTNNNDAELLRRYEALSAEKARQWAHLSARNEQLVCAAARWAVAQALAEDCNLILHEDLDTLETRTFGKTMNGRVNLQVRGALFARIRDLAATYGIRVLASQPRGTSSRCSRCGERSRHYHAPDKPHLRKGEQAHKNWLLCPCGRSADRDHSAAERIGARGLELYASIMEAEDLIGKMTLKQREACERKERAAQVVTATPRVAVRYTKRTRPQPFPSQPKPGQRPCDAGSPRGVSRGSAGASWFSKRQALATQKLGVVTRSKKSCLEPPGWPLPLDGMLYGNRGSVRFTRLRTALAP